MKVAVIGSRELKVDLDKYLPEGITLVVSGGARGIDSLAEGYAERHGIKKLIFLPDYGRYGRQAPLLRNELIVDAADIVYAFWDGVSRGTKYTIDYARAKGKETVVHIIIT
jgi:hypothetical protein